MTAQEITQYLTELNEELRLMEIKGEVSLYDGAVMGFLYIHGKFERRSILLQSGTAWRRIG